MRELDGSDIKYLLEKKGYSLSDVARDLEISPQAVWNYAWGFGSSQKIASHIERLLDMKPGTLRISKGRRPLICKAA